MEDFSCYTGTPAACNLKVFVTFVPRSDDFSRRWLPVESLIRGLPQLLSGNCSTNVNENWWFYVVFHHFPSANCHDIAFSLLRRGLISLGGTSFLLGLVYPSWQVKKLRFKRQEMLLSDLSCCQLQEPEAPHCHPCTTPWRMATLKHHRCGLSSFFGSWKFLSKIVVLGGSSFFSLSYLHSLQTAWYFPEAVGFFRSRGTGEVRFNNIETCTVQRKAPVWCTVESPAVKRDNWRCKACMFDWVGGWSQECFNEQHVWGVGLESLVFLWKANLML